MFFHLFVFVLGVEVPICDCLVPFRRTKSGRSMWCCTLEVWWKRIVLPRSWFVRFFCLVLRYISFSRSSSVDSSWECRVPWRDVLSVGIERFTSPRWGIDRQIVCGPFTNGGYWIDLPASSRRRVRARAKIPPSSGLQ